MDKGRSQHKAFVPLINIYIERLICHIPKEWTPFAEKNLLALLVSPYVPCGTRNTTFFLVNRFF